jgi:AcrR family transcriptional regulator
MKKQPVARKARSNVPQRRTNAERSALTRTRLIQATIDALFEQGYAAATTIEVAKRAKASRGAMLHHFPTRVDLLLAAAEHIISEQRRYRVDKLAAIENDWARFAAETEVAWELTQMRADSAAQLAKTLRVRDVRALDDLILIHNAALRGLTINLMFTQEQAQVDAARQLLMRYEHTFARGLIDKAQKKRSR